MTTQGIGHGVHHNKHYEWCYSLAERQEAIRSTKPINEQAARLAMLGFLPLERLLDSAELVAAWKKYIAACEKMAAASEKAIAGWEKNATYKEFAAAWERYAAQHADMQQLHDELWPGCTWNGQEFVYPKEQHDPG